MEQIEARIRRLERSLSTWRLVSLGSIALAFVACNTSSGPTRKLVITSEDGHHTAEIEPAAIAFKTDGEIRALLGGVPGKPGQALTLFSADGGQVTILASDGGSIAASSKSGTASLLADKSASLSLRDASTTYSVRADGKSVALPMP